MTDFVFITANDIHISDYGPRARTDDFKTTVLGKIVQMGVACSKLNADAGIIAGDLFNLKSPAKNSHQLNQELIKEFKKFPCPVYMIEGNHDLTANKLESLEEQPLGVLFADNTLIQLRHKIIEKESLKVSLVGVPYTENLDLKTLKFPYKEDFVAQIAVMHVYAGLKTGNLFQEHLYGYNELAMLPADIFVLGHYHIDQGVYESEGKHFINIGSMSRGTLSEEDISHQPKLGYIKISVEDGKTSFTVKTIKLKIRPASEVFDLTKKEVEKKEEEEIRVFVEKLAAEAVQTSISEKKSIDNILDAMDLAKTVRDRAIHFIQLATHENKL
jgi:DNA repair exonuclease SbcCD nuclease subunit